eukprot:CAMPEP_0202470868 /NCGR_PEP_ID=MMETSP1360-20130828/82850_1 /ASSEMBLY_ACC=CAM_ASM_000848 /TAXON_ID=515479 /ORGANISM="Licmophora paradoxa, Strain CCMP2313" /LENGTH=130 /DNA_ID=CAMNT_0049096717 /DNA_START=54 /DNA_END=443 /DNA_ORIENTATION=+
MREDILAKRLFMVGCFGLPWLWAVHILYFFRKQKQQSTASAGQQLLTDQSVESTTYNDEPNDDSDGNGSGENNRALALEEKKWVRREIVALVLVSMAWVTWIIVFQILKNEYFSEEWLVRTPDQIDASGW